MPQDRFLIAPYESGQQTNVRPWLIPDDAYASSRNAYVFRGRTKKRFGSYVMNRTVPSAIAQQYTRLRMQIGSTDGAGIALNVTVPGFPITQIGGAFSLGNEMFTIQATGAAVILKTTGTSVATLDTTISTNNLDITSTSLNTSIFYYPGLPVMGLLDFDTDVTNVGLTIGFDTKFAYQFIGGAWTRLAVETTPGASVWSGSDSQFFWSTNYSIVQLAPFMVQNMFFVTNNNPPDFMRYLDNFTGGSWHFFNPNIDGLGSKLTTALMLVPFKGRMVALNTYEHDSSGNDARYPNRARWCQTGSPLQVDAWQTDITGKGGFLQAPTNEAITSCEFVKDRLIVFFEKSTWEFVYTNNQVEPFIWQQVNTELGAESTFSTVPFDQVTISVGNVGVHQCNGLNVDRIDQKIPQTVFQIHNGNDGPIRVYGIRDYTAELIYWTFPNFKYAADIFPTQVLVYNYQNQSWSINDDSITCFGYFQPIVDDTWESDDGTWEEDDSPWVTASEQAQFRKIIGGNQQGFTFIVYPAENKNASVLQITDVTPGVDTTFKVINHNLHADEDYIQFSNLQGTGSVLTSFNGLIWPVKQVFDENTFTVQTPNPTSGTYTGGGTIARVSRIDILTKQYNFYLSQARNFSISKIDFQVDRTALGQIAIDYMTSSSEESLRDMGIENGSIVGNAILETSPYLRVPYEASQERLWHSIYTQADGEFIQLRIYFDDLQMVNSDIVQSEFEMHAMIFYATPTASRLQ